MREPVALDAKRGLKQQQDEWGAGRKKAKFEEDEVASTIQGDAPSLAGGNETR